MMPTKIRLAKERLRKEQANALGECPEHLVGGDMSLNIMAEAIDKNYLYNWVTYSEDGETAYKTLHPEKPSNDKRTEERRAKALRLKEKYPEKWGKRAYADQIAGAEGVGIRTVQKYFKDFP